MPEEFLRIHGGGRGGEVAGGSRGLWSEGWDSVGMLQRSAGSGEWDDVEKGFFGCIGNEDTVEGIVRQRGPVRRLTAPPTLLS